jgi:hypothetical protein
MASEDDPGRGTNGIQCLASLITQGQLSTKAVLIDLVRDGEDLGPRGDSSQAPTTSTE